MNKKMIKKERNSLDSLRLLSFHIYNKDHAWLKKYAYKTGMSQASIVRAALGRFIESTKNKKGADKT